MSLNRTKRALSACAFLLLTALLAGLCSCAGNRQIVKEVDLKEPYLITFSGLSYENDPESCTYVRYGVDAAGNILLETRFFDGEGTLLKNGHLYLKQKEGGYLHYLDSGEGYALAEKNTVSSAAINSAHFQDLYMFQMRLTDATTLFKGGADASGGEEGIFLNRACRFYTVRVKDADEDTGEEYTALYEYTVDDQTGACLRVSYGIVEENGQESSGRSGFVCTEFDLAPALFSELID